MKTYTVEKLWLHKSNCCVVVMNHHTGCRCGYVGIDIEHPLYGIDYDTQVDYLADMRESLEHGTIGKRGIIPLICWDREGVSPEIFFDVHGGLTYSGGGSYPAEVWNSFVLKGKETFYQPWWLGFDCAHVGDGHEIDQIFPEDSRQYYRNFGGDIIRSLDYCVRECESLSWQLEEIR